MLRNEKIRTGKVVSEGFFAWTPSDEAHFYDFDVMAEQGAKGLKKEVKFAEDGGRGHFKRLLKL